MGARMRMVGLAALCAVALMGGTFGTWAQKESDKKGAAPTMTAEQQAMMDAWMKLATPGEAHKKLNQLVGSFDATVKLWMAPGAPPEVT